MTDRGKLRSMPVAESRDAACLYALDLVRYARSLESVGQHEEAAAVRARAAEICRDAQAEEEVLKEDANG